MSLKKKIILAVLVLVLSMGLGILWGILSEKISDKDGRKVRAEQVNPSDPSPPECGESDP